MRHEQSAASPPASDRREAVTLRQGGAFGVWAVTGAFWLLTLILAVVTVQSARGPADIVWALPTLLLLALAGWLLGAYCRLVATPSEVRVVNLLRTVRIPRGLIEDVTDRGMVAVHTRRGGRPYVVRSWGAPSAPRPRYVNNREMRLAERGGHSVKGTTSTTPGIVSRLVTPTTPPSDTSETAARVQVTWNVGPLLLLCFLVVVNVSIWLR